MSLRIFVSASSSGLTDFAPHGDGLVSFALLRQLAERGHSIDLAGTHLHLRGELHDNIKFHEINAGTTDTLGDRIKYAVKVRKLYNVLSKNRKYDIVHQLNPVIAGLSLFLIWRAPPLVLGAYIENWVGDPKAGLLDRLRVGVSGAGRTLLASIQQLAASRIILTTKSARNRVPLSWLLRNKIRIIPHGVDTTKFEPRPSSTSQPITILYLTSLIPRKGIFTLLDSYDILAAQMPNVRLAIGGDGESLPLVLERISASPYADRIDYLGCVPREAINETMARASVYCLPSHGEPFGMTVLEAMACALPVVVTREGGLGEIVPESAGKKVPMRDSVALANALYELLSQPSTELEAMGRRNREYVAEFFALPQIAERIENLYHAVIERN